MNTRNNRSSAINVSQPWRGMLPNPDGTVGQADRQHVAYMYAGISAGGAVAVEEQFRGGGAGGRYRYYTEYYHKPRKVLRCTKKDEEELKRLLLKAAEEDRKAQEALKKKANDLQDVVGGVACIKDAVDSVASDIRGMAMAEDISRKAAKRLLEELYEEEEILLAIIRNS